MDGGYTSFWLTKPLTKEQELLVRHYEKYLESYGWEKGYSFIWRLKPPPNYNQYINEQIAKFLGSEIKQTFVVGGPGVPLFRAVEALMKYFNGYYTICKDSDLKAYLNHDYYIIKKLNKLGIPVYDFHLVDWRFIANYFNERDTDEIRHIYDFEAFISMLRN